MRKPLVAANWKMHTTGDEAITLARGSRDLAGMDVDIVLCPPFVWLERVRDAVQDTNIQIGAQNVFWADWGAYTGEISALQLVELCRYSIVGHSERRHVFRESDAEISRKVKAVARAGMVPILAIGEDDSDYDAGHAQAVLRSQLVKDLALCRPEQLVVAYEPVWAIGTGRPASPEYAEEMAGFIRSMVAAEGLDAETTRVIYGGSVTPDTFEDFLNQPNIDGALVGGASLDSDDFAALVRTAAHQNV